ncbi:MAG: hypothetical protein EBS19_10645 [Spirochaetia bacterium]|nr:hypothetical protein [Spirochaetia bacterium]
MRNLIFALNRANLTESDLETVLTEFDIWIDSKVLRSEQKIMSQFIAPIQRETDGIRSELRILSETMKYGFALIEERFQKLDQKLEFTRENLEKQITSNKENLEIQIASNRESLERQIVSNKENLENQIKALEKNMEKQFSFQQKLLWAVLSVVLGLFAKAIHLI